MKRIMMDRGLGKTTSLFNYAKYLALQDKDTTVFFACFSPETTSKLFSDIPKNIKFIRVSDLLDGSLRGKRYKLVIDEVESLLQLLNVDAYTLTLSDVSW